MLYVYSTEHVSVIWLLLIEPQMLFNMFLFWRQKKKNKNKLNRFLCKYTLSEY